MLAVEVATRGYSGEDARKGQSALQAWDVIMGENPPRHVRLIHRIRDYFFAHWDNKCEAIGPFLDAESGLDEHTTFAIVNDAGTLLGSWPPWEIKAIDMDLFGRMPEPERNELIRQMGSTIAAVINITSSLVAATAEKANLALEPVREGS